MEYKEKLDGYTNNDLISMINKLGSILEDKSIGERVQLDLLSVIYYLQIVVLAKREQERAFTTANLALATEALDKSREIQEREKNA